MADGGGGGDGRAARGRDGGRVGARPRRERGRRHKRDHATSARGRKTWPSRRRSGPIDGRRPRSTLVLNKTATGGATGDDCLRRPLATCVFGCLGDPQTDGCKRRQQRVERLGVRLRIRVLRTDPSDVPVRASFHLMVLVCGIMGACLEFKSLWIQFEHHSARVHDASSRRPSPLHPVSCLLAAHRPRYPFPLSFAAPS